MCYISPATPFIGTTATAHNPTIPSNHNNNNDHHGTIAYSSSTTTLPPTAMDHTTTTTTTCVSPPLSDDETSSSCCSSPAARVSFAMPLHDIPGSGSSSSSSTGSPSPLSQFWEEYETDAWKETLWYQPSDLAQFRAEARDVCRQLRLHCLWAESAQPISQHISQQQQPQQQHQQQPSQQQQSPPIESTRPCLLAFNVQTRGLEQRSCLERQRRKFLANRFIVKAALKVRETGGDEERLAAMARKITSWATELALEEGARDYGRAYGAEEWTGGLSHTTTIAATTTNTPINNKYNHTASTNRSCKRDHSSDTITAAGSIVVVVDNNQDSHTDQRRVVRARLV